MTVLRYYDNQRRKYDHIAHETNEHGVALASSRLETISILPRAAKTHPYPLELAAVTPGIKHYRVSPAA